MPFALMPRLKKALTLQAERSRQPRNIVEVEADADELIASFGDGAYEVARPADGKSVWPRSLTATGRMATGIKSGGQSRDAPEKKSGVTLRHATRTSEGP
jgi:hypothetical protein